MNIMNSLKGEGWCFGQLGNWEFEKICCSMEQTDGFR